MQFIPGVQSCIKMGHVKPTLLNAAFTNSKEFSTFNRAVYGKYKKEFKTFFLFPRLHKLFFC